MNRIELKHLSLYAQLLFLNAVLVFLLQSCKKTEVIDYEKRDQNRILEYRVTNSQQLLMGAIDHINNTITVYLPYYLSIDFLIPDIKLEEGAKLMDAEGGEINPDGGIEPVPIGSEQIYIVKSSAGVEKRYALVQKILPYPVPLKASYSIAPGTDGILNRMTHSRFDILGNFESTSTAAKFIFKDQQTGQEYDNFFSVYNIAPGNTNYTMTVNVMAEAKAGVYDVKMIHQGRTTTLPPIRLRDLKPMFFLTSSASYAVGDTATFLPDGYLQPVFEERNGVFKGVKRMYIKLKQSRITGVPAGFTSDMYNKEFDMKIAEVKADAIKVIIPELPKGNYTGSFAYTGVRLSDSGFGFYCDFSDETGWGKDVLVGSAYGIEIK